MVANGSHLDPIYSRAAQELLYGEILGLTVREKNTFLSCDVPGNDSDSENPNAMPWQRQFSAPATLSTSATGTSASTHTSETTASTCPSEGLANSSDIGDEETKYPSEDPGFRHVNNLCKTKRVRLRKWEDRTVAAINKDPHVDVASLKLPLFVEVNKRLNAKVMAKLRKAKQSVQCQGTYVDARFGVMPTRTGAEWKVQGSRLAMGLRDAAW